MPMPDQERAASASASERNVVEYPSDVSQTLSRLYDDVVADIEEQYGDEEGTPLPLDLELEVEMTVHDRDPEADGDD